MTSFNLSYSLIALSQNTLTLRVRTSNHEFGRILFSPNNILKEIKESKHTFTIAIAYSLLYPGQTLIRLLSCIGLCLPLSLNKHNESGNVSLIRSSWKSADHRETLFLSDPSGYIQILLISAGPCLTVYSSPPLSFVSLSTVSVTHGQPWSENIKWKNQGISNLNCTLF